MKKQHDSEAAADIEAAVAAYRRELVAAAELARGDLDEIEDHLRALALELRDDGMPVAEAVAEAARRLGDPAELAREHARVRPTFGARLSRGRAWSAAGLLAIVLGIIVVRLPDSSGMWTNMHVVLELGLGGLLIVALVARLSWARAVLLGGVGTSVVLMVLLTTLAPEASVEPANFLLFGIVAFLAPWRRRELSTPGWALVLQVWAYGTAVIASSWFPGFAIVASMAGILATGGIILRARWSVVFAGISTIGVVGACVQLAAMPYVSVYWSALLVLLATGAVAAVASAVLQYRTARSRLGTFEAVLR